MLKRDYLEELIRQTAEALAHAIGLYDKKESPDAEAEALEVLRRLAKLPVDTITTIDVATLLPMLGDGTPAAVRVTARALWLLGEIEAARGEGRKARARHVRAMQLYKAVGLGDDPLDQRAAREMALRYKP
ncbi:MAG TPA: hypothetical protein VFB62_07875 [Polyangiaceae bacterium]|jgi:hypothetical protein|nr:hypothetical protein [Polyangiaceae bacterium]